MNEEKQSCSSSSSSKELKGGKSIYCCIPGCTSSFYDRNNNKTDIGFFHFPTDKEEKKAWVRAVNNVRKGPGDNFNITKYTRVCEKHFKKEDIKVSNDFHKRKTRIKGAVPTFKKPEPKKPTRRSPRKRSTEPIHDPVAAEEREPEPEKELSELEVLQKQIDELNVQNQSLINEVKVLKNELQELKGRTYNFENISKDKNLFKSETGLEVDSFEILYDMLNPGEKCENVKMYESKQNEQGNDPNILRSPTAPGSYEHYSAKPGPAVKLNAKDQLFLYMTWLKGGFSLKHSSWLFDLPKSTISRYLITWSNFLYFSLGSLPIWPSKRVVEETMPSTFKDTYPKTRCIIDCTELFCQRPSSFVNPKSYVFTIQESCDI